jgi:hypothetical protein
MQKKRRLNFELQPTSNYVPQTPKDFRNFLYLVWNHLRLPDPTEIQYDIANSLKSGPRRFIIEAFRGEGKSWITSAFVCWTLDQHPEWNILVVSASKQRADDFSTFTLRLIHEMEILQHLIPRDDQRNSKVAFDVAPAPAAHAPSVKSLGITSQLAGSRADLIIPDDIEVPNNSQTQAMRDKLAEQVKEFDAIVKPGGRVVFLGTPQTEQSVYNKLLQRGYQMRVWPARYPSEDEREEYGERLAPYIVSKLESGGPSLIGQPTDPKRFTDLDLREREASYGRAGFAMQFMLRTRLSDLERYPLKVRDLSILNCDPEIAPEKVVWANSPDLVMNDIPNMAMDGDKFYRPMALEGKWIPYQGKIMTIDPSGRGKDELGYCVIGMLNGQLFVLAMGGIQGGYSVENLKALSMIAAKYKVNKIIIEENFGDGMFSALLKPILMKIYACSLEEIKHSKQKELRICDTLEPVIQSHKLILDARMIEEDYKTIQGYGQDIAHQYSLIYQLTRISRDKGALNHDDRLDALAMAVAYWASQMSQDIDESMKDHKDLELDKELAAFMEHALGIKAQEPTWFTV